MRKIIAIIALSSLSLSAAAAEHKDYFVQFTTGYAHGLAPGKDFFKGNMGDSSLFGIEGGYKFNENFRGSLSFDYLPSFSNKFTSSQVIDEDTYTVQSSIKVKSYVTMLNLYYDVIEYNSFTPYVTIGAGVACNKSGDHTTSSNANATTVVTGVDAGATKRNFAYKLGIGSKYAINNSFDLDLRYQYSDLGKFKTSVSQKEYLNGVYIGSSNSDVENGKLRAHTVLAGIAYKF